MSEEADIFKECILNITNSIKEKKIDFSEKPILFVWSYPENENIQYKLYIIDTNKDEVSS